jgi:hypothetical protein
MSENDPTGAAPGRPPVAGESDVAFPRLNETQMATIEAAGRREQVSAGQILFSPGDLDFDLIVVASAALRSSTSTALRVSVSSSATVRASSPAS